MAGCRPEYLPVVLAAVECVLDPDFNMRGVQTTDENVTPLLVVNGPVARELGVNAQLRRARPGLAGQRRDRPRAASGDEQSRRRLAGRGGLCRPRPARPLHALPGRERGAEPVGAAACRAGWRPASAVTVTRAESRDQRHRRTGRDRERHGLGGVGLRHPVERPADRADGARRRRRLRAPRHEQGRRAALPLGARPLAARGLARNPG